MLLLNYSLINSLSVFFSFTYLILVFSLIAYTLPILLSSGSSANFTNKSRFSVIYSSNVLLFLIAPSIILSLLVATWSGPATSIWFGHLVFSNFQAKAIYLVIIAGAIVNLVFASTSYLSSREIYDYVIAKLNMFY